jgi:hypothetical protein
MIVEETFYRPDELAREARSLPCSTYNLARLLVTRSSNGCIFVPIRSMQVLAVLDAEEFIFVDRERGHLVDIAWRHFRPQERAALDEPVAYTAVYYTAGGPKNMLRLQSEFQKSLVQLVRRTPAARGARIIKLARQER